MVPHGEIYSAFDPSPTGGSSGQPRGSTRGATTWVDVLINSLQPKFVLKLVTKQCVFNIRVQVFTCQGLVKSADLHFMAFLKIIIQLKVQWLTHTPLSLGGSAISKAGSLASTISQQRAPAASC